MKRKRNIIVLSLLILLTAGLISFTVSKDVVDDQIISHTVDLNAQNLQLYWKDEQGETLNSIQNLKSFLARKNQTLIFAMNGGMYKQDYTPEGLFILNKETLSPLNTATGYGNFYLKPNGVFYITTDNIPVVCKTTDFKDNGEIKYATQSGPMLIIDGAIHSAFKEGSSNLNIRNGVGILPDNKVLFAMSKTEINFYDFARFFQKSGCKHALYLDGFVSRMYLPEKNWIQTDGRFGVLIGVTEKKNKAEIK